MPVRFLLVAAVATTFSFAQPSPPSEPTATTKDIRETPRGTLLGYLEACRDSDYRRASSFLDTSRGGQNLREAPEESARKLKQILDRKLTRDPNTVSDEPEGDVMDGLDRNLELLGTIRRAGGPVDLFLERVSLPEFGNVWLISSKTIGLIPLLQSDIRSNPIEAYMPQWMLRNVAFDTTIWQWIALALLIIVSYLLGRILARTAIRSLGPLVRRTRSEMDDHLIKSLQKPMQLLIALAAYRVGIVWIGPSYVLRMYLGRFLTAVIYFSMAWIIFRLVDVVTSKLVSRMSGRQKTSVASIMPLTRRTLKVLAIGIAILATLTSWGYDTTALLAGLGVGGLAVALAAQKTLENLFGGVAVTTDKPVLVGDFCRYGEKIGTVEDIGLRSTRIRTLDRTVVTVPNADFSSLQIENFGLRDKMSFRPVIQLRKDTTPQQLRTLLPRLRQVLLDDPMIERTPRVRLISLGPDSIDVEIFSYVLTPDFDDFLKKQEELLLGLLDVVEDEGTSLAVPIQYTVLSREGDLSDDEIPLEPNPAEP